MATLRVRDVRVTPATGGTVVSARLDARRFGWHDEYLWFHLPRDYAPDMVPGDTFATALLLPAMVAGVDVPIDAPVSGSLVANLDRAQALLTSWNRRNPWARLHRIDLRAAEPAPLPPTRCMAPRSPAPALDVLDRFQTLPHKIDPADIASILAEPEHRVFLWEDLAVRLRQRRDGQALADAIQQLIDRSRRAGRVPGLRDLTTREGRRAVREWLRRQVQPRLPVAVRRRLLPLHRRGRI